MWVPVSPRPLDFCGCPPCPLCFRWAGGDKPDGGGYEDSMKRLSLELLQKPWEELDDVQKRKLEKLGERIHLRKVNVSPTPPKELPPLEEVDIGMSRTKRMNAWLKDKKKEKEKPERQLTCDEIYANMPKEEVEAFESLRSTPVRKDPLAGVDPAFVEYARRRWGGNIPPKFILARWNEVRSNVRYTE